jgi:uncharacterized protein (TIGR04255 family)
MTAFVRPHYTRAPIAEAVIDIRVANPGAVALSAVTEAADALAKEFPSRLPIQQFQMGFQTDASNPASSQFTNNQELLGWRLLSKTQDRVLQLQRVGFSYSHLPPYSDWENFRSEAKGHWSTFEKALGDAGGVSRIAVRIINRIPVPKTQVDLSKYLTVYPVVPESLPSTANALFVQLQLSMPHIYPDARAIINVASGAVDENGAHVILDIDLFVERIVSNDEEMWDVLEKFGFEKDVIFETCITDEVREAIR